MTKITSSLFLAVLLALCLHVASAQAQLVRTCVSMAKGNDANASSQCHCSTPCRTFATAAANTLADGEITVLDPGDYGGLTITRSISINNDSGGEASITVSGNATGIIISAPADAYVNLRGLTIQGVGFGITTGLRFNTGLFLTMTNCTIRNHTSGGMEFVPNANSNLTVSNTLITDNGRDGILVQPSSSPAVKVTLDRVGTYNNSRNGVLLDGQVAFSGSISGVITDSVSAGNAAAGFSASTTGSHPNPVVNIVRSTAAYNAAGISTSGPATTIAISQSTVTMNTTGLSAGASTNLISYSDNVVFNNVTTGAPTATLTKL